MKDAHYISRGNKFYYKSAALTNGKRTPSQEVSSWVYTGKGKIASPTLSKVNQGLGLGK